MTMERSIKLTPSLLSSEINRGLGMQFSWDTIVTNSDNRPTNAMSLDHIFSLKDGEKQRSKWEN